MIPPPRVSSAAPLDQALAASAATAARWTQSAADAAWCNLKEPDWGQGAEAVSSEQIEARLKEMPAQRQLTAEADRLTKRWAQDLKQRGDERSLAMAALIDGSAEAQGRLLDMARHTRDPAVYAWALGMCRATGPCEALSPRRWAQLDPGNMTPWIYEAGDARHRKDEQGVQEAVYQISRSSRSERYVGPLLQVMDGQREATAPGLQMMAELAVPMSMTWIYMLPSYAPVTQYCSTSTADPARAAVCTNVAEALWGQTDTLLDRSIALAIARRLPSEEAARWTARADERDAMMVASRENAEELNEGGAPCSLLPFLERRLKAQASLGEWGALRARLEGRDVAALARKYREGMAEARTRDNPASAVRPGS
ncbi:MAG TPA: hypothetical protein VGM81_18830 [Burkholderiaceae bacterium]